MFGYVTIHKPELKVKEYYRYKGYYCGLCNTLKRKYGKIGQMTLTYDMTFLVILLTSLYESKVREEKHRCIVHPGKKHWMLENEITEYAADMNIALTYHHLLDNWEDEKSLPGLAAAKILKRQYCLIAQKYPRQCTVMETTLQELRRHEKSREENIEVLADCFGRLMEELFVYQEDVWAKSLRMMGYFLGKFIYILDAYVDIEQDIKNNCFNPLKSFCCEEDFDVKCMDILTATISEGVKEFEKLPLMEEVEILRNILYAGVWIQFSKTRIKRKEGKEEEHEKSI
ncbi:DUF5685 family protein [Anaeromicropila populeti]|uniref:Uncharacterized protein n=1 Tax=Anaeromicropila populeti TaxID=37658 RepID=A0A1I6HMR3_9FIRM|nr:DUF5685 family protein [Anaeromicropila populeti]SFR55759.1 hypothetical protein SAMN05661086_00108 [Anaeromicropila populeti]